jgi:hypothetical protein
VSTHRVHVRQAKTPYGTYEHPLHKLCTHSVTRCLLSASSSLSLVERTSNPADGRETYQTETPQGFEAKAVQRSCVLWG